MKNKYTYSFNSQLIYILMCSLGIDRDGADAIIGNNPQFQKLEIDKLNEMLNRIQFRYLFSRFDAKKLLIERTDLFLNPNIIIEKDKLFKELFNCGDVEFGIMLKANFRLLDFTNSDIIEFVEKVQQECGVSHEFVRKLFSQCDNQLLSTTSGNINTLKNKINLLKLYGLSTADIEQHPTLCANQLQNIDVKMKIAYLTKVPLHDYLEKGYYKHQKEKIYARFMGQIQRLYRVNIYALEPTFNRQAKYSTTQLMDLYPWDEEASRLVDHLFDKYHTMLSIESHSFFNNLQANDKTEQETQE